MSLPSKVIFKKDDEIVGAGFCNVGWFVTTNRLIQCIFEGWQNAINRFDLDISTLNEQELKYFNIEKERTNDYFSTRENLLAFTHAQLYGFSIPRDIVNSLYRKELSNDEFEKQLEEWKI